MTFSRCVLRVRICEIAGRKLSVMVQAWRAVRAAKATAMMMAAATHLVRTLSSVSNVIVACTARRRYEFKSPPAAGARPGRTLTGTCLLDRLRKYGTTGLGVPVDGPILSATTSVRSVRSSLAESVDCIGEGTWKAATF